MNILSLFGQSFKFYICSLLILASFTVSAQDEEIDASKPTNFYTFLDNTLEYQEINGGNLFGYRGNITWAPSSEHLILGEIPLLHNSVTDKFGIGNIRARYFYLPYKNYDKFFGAFGPSVDVFAPTGSFEDGLGDSRWTISPGITVGLMAADWIQFFPIVSYQYSSKPVNDAAKMAIGDFSTTGFTFQVITPLVFSDNFFIQVTPIWANTKTNGVTTDGFVQEIFGAYTLANGMQLTGFYKRDFDNSLNTFRAGLTIFL
ncbi:hypothetical protein [Reichenbachiella sp.]|uniref:hypothetical protein n=1 Tax=Reichenbachiella sp. TaxID=2184521 RepID=UPI003B5C74F0